MKSSELLKLLTKDGWVKVRQSGSHIIMEYPIKTNTIVFPYHGSKEVGKGLEKRYASKQVCNMAAI